MTGKWFNPSWNLVWATGRSEVQANEELLCEHMCLENEAQGQAAKLALMHVVDLGKAQEAAALFVTCRRWLHTCKDSPFPMHC